MRAPPEQPGFLAHLNVERSSPYREDWQMDMLSVVFALAVIAVAIAAFFLRDAPREKVLRHTKKSPGTMAGAKGTRRKQGYAMRRAFRRTDHIDTEGLEQLAVPRI